MTIVTLGIGAPTSHTQRASMMVRRSKRAHSPGDLARIPPLTTGSGKARLSGKWRIRSRVSGGAVFEANVLKAPIVQLSMKQASTEWSALDLHRTYARMPRKNRKLLDIGKYEFICRHQKYAPIALGF